MSWNETLRTAKSSRAGASVAAVSGAGGIAELENPTPSAELSWPGGTGPGRGRSERVPPGRHWSRLDVTPAPWRGGFRAARRHSARIRLFRRLAIAGSLLAIILVSAVAFIGQSRRLPVDVSLGKVGLEGTKVTLDSPKITGVQKDGRPFEIKAHSAIQDVAAPTVIELLGIESTIGTADNSTTWVTAERGVYDSTHDKLALEGDIRIKNSAGYDIWLKSARIDFKTGGLISDEPVKVLIEGGTIAATEIDVSEHGHKVSFGGNVTSSIETAEKEPDAADALPESGK